MGTRCLTRVIDDGKPLLCLYRQFDGYEDGHGEELAEFLRGMVVVNGIGIKEDRKLANGMGCLAAQLVAHFKKDVGGFYIYPADTNCGAYYVYTIYVDKEPGDFIDKEAPVMLKVEYTLDNKVLFDGKADDYRKKATKKTAQPAKKVKLSWEEHVVLLKAGGCPVGDIPTKEQYEQQK